MHILRNKVKHLILASVGLFQVELTFSPEALRAISKQAMEKKTGARGLRAIMVFGLEP